MLKGCGGGHPYNPFRQVCNVISSKKLLVAKFPQRQFGRASRRETSTEVSRKLQRLILRRKWLPLINCKEPNNETQTELAEPIINKKNFEQCLLSAIDKFSKNSTNEIFNNASGPNVIMSYKNINILKTEFIF